MLTKWASWSTFYTISLVAIVVTFLAVVVHDVDEVRIAYDAHSFRELSFIVGIPPGVPRIKIEIVVRSFRLVTESIIGSRGPFQICNWAQSALVVPVPIVASDPVPVVFHIIFLELELRVSLEMSAPDSGPLLTFLLYEAQEFLILFNRSFHSFKVCFCDNIIQGVCESGALMSFRC